MTIKKSIEVYLTWKGTHTRSAVKSYAVRLWHFARNISLEKQIDMIYGDDVINYHRSMQAQGFSPATVAYSARILKNFFRFWQGRGFKNLNPTEIIPIRYIKADRDVASQEDVNELLEILDNRNYGNLIKMVVIKMLWDTGIRVSELCDINLSAISGQSNNGIRTAKVRTRKSMRYNLIMWGRETNRLLNQYLGLRMCLEDVSTDALFVTQRFKRRITTRTIQRWIKDLCKQAMIDKELTPHSFRHGKAHHILDTGGNVRDVQAILRHVDPASSFNYLQLNQTKYLQVAEKYLS